MRLKTFFVLLLAGIWGIGSWWWYTCKIKSYCAESSPLSALIGSGLQTATDNYNELMGQAGTDRIGESNAATSQDDSAASITAETAPTDHSSPAPTTATSIDDTATTTDNSGTPSNSGTASAETSTTETRETAASTDATAATAPTTTVQTDSNAQTDASAAETATADTAATTPTDDKASQNTTGTDTAEGDQDKVADTEAATSQNTNEAEATTIDPTPPSQTDTTDSDGDGLSDALEQRLATNPNSPDSDGDGLHDQAEVGDNPTQPRDSDNDGIIDAKDTDDDNDGDLTSDEAADPDQNGLPDDARDDNADGTPDYLDATTNQESRDDDGDGLSNSVEKRIGTNPTLTDSDGDGLSDRYESADQKDSDGDGTIDALDPDDDDDGIMTVMESADPNGDGNPDDAVDSNDNNKPDYLDTDNTPSELPSEREIQQGVTSSTDSDANATTVGDSSNTEQSAVPIPEDTAEPQDGSDTATASSEAAPQAPTSEAATNTEPVNIESRQLYFSFRSTELELEDNVAQYVDQVIKQLNDHPNVKIKLTGHTDSVGRGGPNRELGLKRARQVRDMLVKRGAPREQIEVDSAGEGEPIADNQTETGRRKNRRVELEQIQ